MERRTILTAVAVLAAAACGEGAGSTVPPAEIYGSAANFEGEWIGEVGGAMGVLGVSALGGGRYRGEFESDDAAIRYVMSLEQTMVTPSGQAAPVPSNRVLFTWQDGRGGRGRGWLMVNREDSALTGESGYGDGGGGAVVWQLIRVE